ncbi:hypothetical protein O7626_40330 [Micromonospora sp. WMMD1102]|uniref:hypothetical protein n=1 Tax=Micromonospora sp. WMMD1102 TaxID=3016105 RepID=UPI002415251F|nr:hypothetical protein [Micromonospora sp. WMMD1102]MDG4792066.1 hypothetical protein [Micromonospora sp. WMMD1102]
MSITFAPATVGGPTVNMANGNAAQVLDLLGLTNDGCGELAAEDFLGRVLLAQALSDVATDDTRGLPARIEGTNWIDCGRRPGYLAERLTQLHEIASWARERNAVVMWS